MANRMDLFLDMIGGEDALPRKLTPPPPAEEVSEPEAPRPIWHTDYQTDEYKDLPHDESAYDLVQLNSALPGLRQASGSGSPSPALTVDAHVPFDVKKGEALPNGTTLSPFVAVTKYCYKFVPKQWSQPLATALFDSDKIYTRDWDLYYITADSHGLHTFVPTRQLQALIDEINVRFDTAKIAIDDWQRANGFTLDFSDLPPNLRPRYLGRCTSRSTFVSWVGQLQSEPNMVLSTIPSGDSSVAAFKARLDAAAALNKAKQKAGRARKHQEILASRQNIVRQAIRGQQYLGLRAKSDDEAVLSDVAINPDLPVPFRFDQEPILIALDCEAFERAPHMITEVGLAILDTRDLKGVAPGENGANWHRLICGRHLRILEWKDYKNSAFVQGCPGAYQFGDSEFVPKSSVATVLGQCFQPPFSKSPGGKTGFPPLPSANNKKSAFLHTPAVNGPSELRNIIVVGHDLGGDVKYCEQLGFYIFNGTNVIDTLDTIDLFKRYMREPNTRSLGSILAHFDMAGWYLHNAGNDAMYTMHALLAMCVKAASGKGAEAEAENLQEMAAEKLETSIEVAKERAREEAEGWDLTAQDASRARRPTQWDFQPKPKDTKGRDSQGTGRLYTLGGAPLDV